MKVIAFLSALPVTLVGAGYADLSGVLHTTSGLVRGHKAPRAPNVTAYLGIPYAQPPISNLRFAPPLRYESTGNKFFGDKLGNSCPIYSTYTSDLLPDPNAGLNFTEAGVEYFNAIAQVNETFSEDCLTLNIWSKNVGQGRRTGVLLFVPGGGYVAGSANAKTYDGAKFVDQEDIVVVTFNYRVNILGFPGAPGTGNLGLLDQRLAVEWVRDNIAKFGGDPSRITIAGQSAGGGSVDYYSYAWTGDPIVAGFIAESGTVQLVEPLPEDLAAENWFNTTGLLGCGNATSNRDEVLRCMRLKNVSEIMGATTQVSIGSVLFTPFVDEVTVFKDYPARAAVGNFTKRPLLIGHNDFEASLFDLIQRLKGVVLPSFWSDFQSARFFCPVAARAKISTQYNIPTWRYRYFGDWADMRLSKIVPTGAYHGAEVNVLFDTVPHGHGIPGSTQEELKFGRYMRGAWANFVADPIHGLEKYGWPAYSSSTESLVRLAYGNSSTTSVAYPSIYDSSCNFPA
ncbi:hypothetical protein DPSP01_007907 [Paraphaeosphaeria sporulosa]